MEIRVSLGLCRTLLERMKRKILLDVLHILPALQHSPKKKYVKFIYFQKGVIFMHRHYLDNITKTAIVPLSIVHISFHLQSSSDHSQSSKKNFSITAELLIHRAQEDIFYLHKRGK